ncbi:NTP transferase domain-containing protein [Herbiconiux liukaitaii]|uniref:NTP transferase domain-containing protein n=1 Tax=Herbiconiux liukaitaii TaxID=3342799 RepID=UPI0035BAD524
MAPSLSPVVGVLLAAGAGTRMGRPKALVRAADGEPWLLRGVRTLAAGGCITVIVVLGAEAEAAQRLLEAPASPTDLPAAPEGTTAEPSTPPAGLTTEPSTPPAGLTTAAPTPPAGLTTAAPTPPAGVTTAASTAAAGSAAAGAAGVVCVVAEGWEEGIAASLRAGLGAARSVIAGDYRGGGAALAPSAVVITLVDLPGLEAAAVRRLVEGAGPTTLRQAFYGGRPGHPVVVGVDHLDALAAAVSGDTGARPYLMAHGAEHVDCTDLGGGDDVDTPPPA